MTLEESKEVIPMMEAMITQIEGQQNIIATVPDYQGKGYAKSLIDFIVEKYREQYAILQVGTGDSPLTIPFYEKCGFVRSHIIPNFFTDNYDHPIYEDGVQLVDMVYLQRPL